MTRPLTVYDRNELVPFCDGAGSPWCDDESCACDRYEASRNVPITRIKSNNAMEMKHIPVEIKIPRDTLFGLTEKQWTIGIVVLGIAFLLVLAGGFIPR